MTEKSSNGKMMGKLFSEDINILFKNKGEGNRITSKLS